MLRGTYNILNTRTHVHTPIYHRREIHTDVPYTSVLYIYVYVYVCVCVCVCVLCLMLFMETMTHTPP